MKGKILIVDDEPHIRQLVNNTLGKDYNILQASNGEEAMVIALNQKPDLILLDIKLPGMNRIELYHCIQATDPALAQRILFITGDVLQKTTRDFFAQSKMYHIAKPFTIEQLKKGINHVFSSAMAYHI